MTKELFVFSILLATFQPQRAYSAEKKGHFGDRASRGRAFDKLPNWFKDLWRPDVVYFKIVPPSDKPATLGEFDLSLRQFPDAEGKYHTYDQPIEHHLREHNDVSGDKRRTVWRYGKKIAGDNNQLALVADMSGGSRGVFLPPGTPLERPKLTDPNLTFFYHPQEADVLSKVSVMGLVGEDTLLFEYHDNLGSFELATEATTLNDQDLVILKKLLNTYANRGDSQLPVYSSDGTRRVYSSDEIATMLGP